MGDIMFTGHKAIIVAILTLLFIAILSPSVLCDYNCGDANGNGVLDDSDPAYITAYLFNGGPAPLGNSDVDGCGSVNLSDVYYLYHYLHSDGPPPCQNPSPCFLPAGENAIILGCPIYDPPGGIATTLAMPVYLTNDTTINGFSVGFHYDSDIIKIVDINLDGSLLQYSGSDIGAEAFPDENIFHVYWTGWPIGSDDIWPSDSMLLFYLVIERPYGTPDMVIDVDTIGSPFVLYPDGDVVLTTDQGATIKPAFLDCGDSDIVLYDISFICGDANSDDEVNVSDAVLIINFVFLGNVFPEMYEAADANCDTTVNVSDAVWIINYVFINGNNPCDTDGNAIPDCYYSD